jgi:hypothetical protein
MKLELGVLTHPLEEGQEGPDADGTDEAERVREAEQQPLPRSFLVAAPARPVAGGPDPQRRVYAVQRRQHIHDTLLGIICPRTTLCPVNNPHSTLDIGSHNNAISMTLVGLSKAQGYGVSRFMTLSLGLSAQGNAIYLFDIGPLTLHRQSVAEQSDIHDSCLVIISKKCGDS